MSISGDDVRHVARLARLELSDDEVERFRKQLGAVLEHAQRMQQLDLDDVPPTAHPVEIRNVLRPDEVVPPTPSEEILKAAPAGAEGFVQVPRILEEEG